jgi:excisionase family DNA binding protein
MSARLYSVVEAADHLGVSTKTVRRWIASGHLSAQRVGPRLIRIPSASITELTGRQRIGAA